MTPELQSKIVEWRAKCVNHTITKEEMKEAYFALRAGRKTAAAATPKAKAAKAKAVIPSADDLLKEMGLEDDDSES